MFATALDCVIGLRMSRAMLKPVLRIGAIVIFLLAIALYFWFNMRVPPPRERDRVSHPGGLYSIISPRGWEFAFNTKPHDRYVDSMEVRFPTPRPREKRIFIGRYAEPPVLDQIRALNEKMIAQQFQGKPAWVFEGRSRLEFYWRAIFERGGQWYELVFWNPLPEKVSETRWWDYLQTFRAEESPATRSTTTTTTAPSTTQPSAMW
jgi:hypothetical protein